MGLTKLPYIPICFDRDTYKVDSVCGQVVRSSLQSDDEKYASDVQCALYIAQTLSKVGVIKTLSGELFSAEFCISHCA